MNAARIDFSYSSTSGSANPKDMKKKSQYDLAIGKRKVTKSKAAAAK